MTINRELMTTEVQTQDIPRNDKENNKVTAASRPLFELEEISVIGENRIKKRRRALFPFAIDRTAEYFDQLRHRSSLPDWKQSPNRTALVIGESSFAAMLQYLEEDTIIVADVNIAMVDFMKEYVKQLRQAASIDEWEAAMIDHYAISGKIEDAFGDLDIQKESWVKRGIPHALENDDEFKKAQKIARSKAIVVAAVDITHLDSIYALKAILDEYNATITFINLTNLIGYPTAFANKSNAVQALEKLPVSEYAPILVSSLYAESPMDGGVDTLPEKKHLLDQVGPFFGVGNLATARVVRVAGSVEHLRRQQLSEL